MASKLSITMGKLNDYYHFFYVDDPLAKCKYSIN